MVKNRSYIATPPGATIREQLKYRGMSQKEFATRMDMSEKHVSRLINGEVQLTPEVSVRLEIVLGVPANFWNNLEAIYREKLIKFQAENSMEKDETLANSLPYNEMAKFEWVPKTDNIKERVGHLRRYFEVVELGLLSNSQITRIACKGLSVDDKEDLAFLAWVQEARKKSREKNVERFDIKKLNEQIGYIVEIVKCGVNNSIAEIEDILSECGVSLIFLPHLEGAMLKGATFTDGNKVVIALTEDEKKKEDYAKSLFHELAHIVLGHLNKENGTSMKDEQDADEWASKMIGDR